MSDDSAQPVATVRVLSVLQVLGHPRDSKRIAMLKEAGFAVRALVFERDYHAGRMPDCELQLLGRAPSGGYLARVPHLLAAVPVIRRAARDSDIIYASGQDVAIVALLATLGLGKPLVIEIGDIRALQVAAGVKGRLVRALDRLMIDRCSLLVATAPSFVDSYYREWLGSTLPAIIVENKLEPSTTVASSSPQQQPLPRGRPLVDRPLRIGYFGVLRCLWSWRVLRALAAARPDDIEVLIAGIPTHPVDLAGRCDELPNVEFLGPFKSPEDLPDLYGRVDLVWGCYPHPSPEDWNWRWARTNRFYESCFYQKPIVALAQSGDAHMVESHGIGMMVQRDDPKQVAHRLGQITAADLESWQRNMAALPRNVHTYTTETTALKDALHTLLRPPGEHSD